MRRATSGEPATAYVVDACVIAKWAIPEDDSDRALRLLALAERGEARLLAPSLWRVEVTNVVWKHLQRGLLHPADADAAVALLRHLPIENVPDARVLEPAFTIAVEAGVSVYDALYAALAFDTLAPLVTADRRLAERLRARWPDFGVVGVWEG